MTTQIDLHIMELLASKICHDLISPIGAINNGIELVEELGMNAGDEAMALIGYSAAQSSAKLQAYRMAYGAGGADTSIKPEDVHTAIEAMITGDKKIAQAWDPHAPLGPEDRPSGFAKILVCVFLLAMDCLPKGGTMSASNQDGNAVVSARGINCATRNDMESCIALSFPQNQLEPKHIHAYVCGIIAKQYGYGLEIQPAGDDAVDFVIIPPAA